MFELGLEVVIVSLVATFNAPSITTKPVPFVDATAEPPAVVMVLLAFIASAKLTALAFRSSDEAGELAVAS